MDILTESTMYFMCHQFLYCAIYNFLRKYIVKLETLEEII